MVGSVSSKFGGLTIWANTLHPIVTFQLVYACLNSYWQVIAWALNSYFTPGVSCWLVLPFDVYLFPVFEALILTLHPRICDPLSSAGLQWIMTQCFPSCTHFIISQTMAGLLILSHDLLFPLILLSPTSILSWPFPALSLQFWSSSQCYVWHNITFWQIFTKIL